MAELIDRTSGTSSTGSSYKKNEPRITRRRSREEAFSFPLWSEPNLPPPHISSSFASLSSESSSGRFWDASDEETIVTDEDASQFPRLREQVKRMDDRLMQEMRPIWKARSPRVDDDDDDEKEDGLSQELLGLEESEWILRREMQQFEEALLSQPGYFFSYSSTRRNHHANDERRGDVSQHFAEAILEEDDETDAVREGPFTTGPLSSFIMTLNCPTELPDCSHHSCFASPFSLQLHDKTFITSLPSKNKPPILENEITSQENNTEAKTMTNAGVTKSTHFETSYSNLSEVSRTIRRERTARVNLASLGEDQPVKPYRSSKLSPGIEFPSVPIMIQVEASNSELSDISHTKHLRCTNSLCTSPKDRTIPAAGPKEVSPASKENPASPVLIRMSRTDQTWQSAKEILKGHSSSPVEYRDAECIPKPVRTSTSSESAEGAQEILKDELQMMQSMDDFVSDDKKNEDDPGTETLQYEGISVIDTNKSHEDFGEFEMQKSESSDISPLPSFRSRSFEVFDADFLHCNGLMPDSYFLVNSILRESSSEAPTVKRSPSIDGSFKTEDSDYLILDQILLESSSDEQTFQTKKWDGPPSSGENFQSCIQGPTRRQGLVGASSSVDDGISEEPITSTPLRKLVEVGTLFGESFTTSSSPDIMACSLPLPRKSDKERSTNALVENHEPKFVSPKERLEAIRSYDDYELERLFGSAGHMEDVSENYDQDEVLSSLVRIYARSKTATGRIPDIEPTVSCILRMIEEDKQNAEYSFDEDYNREKVIPSQASIDARSQVGCDNRSDDYIVKIEESSSRIAQIASEDPSVSDAVHRIKRVAKGALDHAANGGVLVLPQHCYLRQTVDKISDKFEQNESSHRPSRTSEKQTMLGKLLDCLGGWCAGPSATKNVSTDGNVGVEIKPEDASLHTEEPTATADDHDDDGSIYFHIPSLGLHITVNCMNRSTFASRAQIPEHRHYLYVQTFQIWVLI